MAEDAKTRELIEGVVAEVFDQHVRALHDDVVGRVMTALDGFEKSRPEKPVSEWLKAAISGIEGSVQQTEILKALLDGTAQFAERAALFVLRGSTGVLWQAKGFPDNDVLKTISIDVNGGFCAAAVRDRSVCVGQVGEFHNRFADIGPDSPCVVLPLVIREKVAALLYCDSNNEQRPLDLSALEVMVRAAGTWVEMQALRKSAGLPATVPNVAAVAALGAPAHPKAEPAKPVQQSKPVEEPKPVPAPTTREEEAKPVQVLKPETVAHAQPSPAPVSQHKSAPAQAAIAAGTNDTQLPAEEQELHRKARRFAKLLVDEIILYNREKVNEGRRNQDLYDRLKDDIDKSRATYEKRYGGTCAGKSDYFRQAVVTGLAEHNMTLLGSNFPR